MCGTARAPRPRSHGTTPADHSEQDHDDGDHQQHMDEPAHGEGGDEPQGPEDEEDDSDGVEHVLFSLVAPDHGLSPGIFSASADISRARAYFVILFRHMCADTRTAT